MGLAALAVWVSPAGAQGRPAPRPAAGPGGDEEMRAALEQVMLVRLKRTLELTPDQEGRVTPRIEALLAARRQFAPQRRVAVAHLKAVMTDPAASDAEIQKALKGVHEMDDAFRQQEQGLKHDVDRELTPRQQARLYFFEEHFRRAMQRRMMEAMQQRGAPGRQQPPGPAADQDDDGPDD
jgi:site-specific DNA-cytosine methylase